MKHVSTMALLAGAIELKGDDDDPVAVVTKAIADLQAAVDERLKKLEEKGADPGDDETVKKLLARIDALEKKANRPNGGGDDDPDEKARAAAERKGFGAYLRRGNNASPDDLKALTVSSDPNGGYLAPAEMSAEFIRDLTEFSPIRSLASVRTTTAPSVKYPKRTGITNAQWEGEGDDQEESSPTFGQLDVPARTLTTYVDISNQLLSDSGGQAEAEVNLALAEDFGQKEALAFVSGDGVLAPEGFLTASGVAYTASGNASTLGSAPADLLITLMYALPAAYRNRGTWTMNGSTLASIRKLKDGQGNFLWQPSYQAGQPETILGRPVVEAVDMPDIGSGAEPIAFGDFETAYRIVDRMGMSILVNPYLLATKGLTRIHATRRVGAGVIQPNAIRKVRCATS